MYVSKVACYREDNSILQKQTWPQDMCLTSWLTYTHILYTCIKNLHLVSIEAYYLYSYIAIKLNY